VVIATRPTTLAGTLALLEYIGACDEESDDILTMADPNSHSPREGYAYHTLIGTLIDALRPLAA
jgi:hypothetical protein